MGKAPRGTGEEQRPRERGTSGWQDHRAARQRRHAAVDSGTSAGVLLKFLGPSPYHATPCEALLASPRASPARHDAHDGRIMKCRSYDAPWGLMTDIRVSNKTNTYLIYPLPAAATNPNMQL
ncbi:hypothetical protein E2C01_094498 [Portunus trituberculatus]|uniref:Uncharacterized protein n=1 Tax=Portunus trituberculatus TaxID=210409 RepID=A0A5B7JSK2_PORTR|nr:hypothetical protein [Portunus trituberculatus]